MLSRALEWNRRRRERNHAHEAAWLGQDVPGPTGLSPFQELFETHLAKTLSDRKLTLENRQVFRGQEEPYIEGEIMGGKWKIWIYIDQAQAIGPSRRCIDLEAWAAATPEELAKQFLECLGREPDGEAKP